MRIFQFGILSKNLIFPFLLPIFQCLRTILSDHISNSYKEVIDMTKHPFILSFLMFVGCIGAGFFELITCFRTKTKSRETEITMESKGNTDLTIVINKQNKPKSVILYNAIKLIGIIFCLIFCDLTAFTGLIISSNTRSNSSELEFQLGGSTMIFTALLSIPVLHTRLYRHQITSIGIIIFGTFLISVRTFIELSIEDISSSFLILGCYFFWSIQEVFDKMVMEKLFLSPFLLLLLSGATGAIFLIILFPIMNLIPCSREFCEGGFTENIIPSLQRIGTSSELILLLTLYCFISMGLNINIMVTKKLLSPTHKTASDSLSSIYKWIFIMVMNNSIGDNFPFALIGYFMIILGALIYNEIIICYVFNLNVNTRKEVIKRSILDSELKIELPSVNSSENCFEETYLGSERKL